MWDWLEGREVRRLALPESTGQERPRPDLPPGTDLLPQIRHIVVLMMENHSYDNYLGMLPGRGEGFPLGADGEPEVSNPGSDGKVRAHHLESTRQVPCVPAQTWHASHVQWDGGTCEGFVRSVATVPDRDRRHAPGGGDTIPMGHWDESDLPFYYGLAKTFPLADHWFSSCLGPTFPNRRFLISGTANGLIDDLPFDIVDYPENGTIFDMLTRYGISWVNYHPVRRERAVLRRVIGGRGVAKLRRLASLGSWFPPLVNAVRGNKTFTADLYPLGLARCMLHLRSIPQFLADADAGNLPSFCIVDPDFSAWSEENPQDSRRGESFAAEIVNRVMHGRAWRDTLLIWTYDEHGGYYDHVTPPAAVPPDDVPGRSLVAHPSLLRSVLKVFFRGYVEHAEQLVAGPNGYDTYGFRVPAVIVSPYARRDFVLSDILDHTSVLKLIEEKWNLPALTRRDAAATSPLGALDLTAPPAFLTPPELPAPTLRWGAW